MGVVRYPDVEPQLIRQCASGEEEANTWWSLFERLRPRIQGVLKVTLQCNGHFPTRMLVEDLEQEVYCCLLERDRAVLRRFRGATRGEAGEYLNRVARSVALDYLNYACASKRTPPPELVAQGKKDKPWIPYASNLVFRVAPERFFIKRDALRRFWSLCAQVVGSVNTAEKLKVLRQAWMEGMSNQDIVAASGGRWTAASLEVFLEETERQLRRLGILLGPVTGERRAPKRKSRSPALRGPQSP
jgi:DNA-directed RNA polymerase specialized sigma24 family protein